MHSRNHNNAVRARKDEKPAWHCLLGEMICGSVCVFDREGVFDKAQAAILSLLCIKLV